MISSRIYNEGVFGPAFDHMSLIVKLEDEWLIDVGYGDLFIEPLKLHSIEVQEHRFKNYRIEKLNDSEFLLSESLKNSEEFIEKYSFDLRSRNIDDFYDQCIIKQSSPDSYFVKNVICTMPIETGRKTILNEKFKIKNGDYVEEREVMNNNDLLEILGKDFHISVKN